MNSEIRLYFTKRFTRGPLKGLHHIDSIPFVSVDAAMDWVCKVKANSKHSKRRTFEIVDHSFQNYAR